MNQSLTTKALAEALLQQLRSAAPLHGLDSHVAPEDREAIDTTIARDCILRVRAQVRGPTARRRYSANLSLAYPSTETDYDELWSVERREPSERYFPLTCNLSELTDVPPGGVPASDSGAVDHLAKKINEAVREHVWPLRAREAARTELERGHRSLWYSLVAFENWMPVALLLEEGFQPAYAFAQEVLAQQKEDVSARTIAYRRFLVKLKRRAEN